MSIDTTLPADKKSFAFVSKAQTLEALAKFSDFNVPPLFSFDVRSWTASRDTIMSRVAQIFSGAQVAIRSSCLREDSCDFSSAGAFLSVLNISSADKTALAAAIDDVILSYGTASPADEVLVQAMILNPVVTGVIMTRSLTDGTPYYVINYDDKSGKTDTVTGGCGASKTVYVYRKVRESDFDSERLKSFVNLARRVEEVCGRDALDIEFCLDKDGVLHLLQTRPICAQNSWSNVADSVNGHISFISDFVAQKTGKTPGLYGQRSILGVMSDWNPAEMIGILPHPLDISLYRELITSRVWSSAREKMGYQPVSAVELMCVIAGRPFIDVRASFNSFLPAGIDPVTAEALVSAWLERLTLNPQYHDKVEFEIALTSMDFCFEERMDSRYPDLLTATRRDAFKKSLANLTGRCLEPLSSLDAALERITELRTRQSGRLLSHYEASIQNVQALLSECRKFGTLPFSILARHAFIAENLLKSAIARGAITEKRIAEFKRSIRTVAGEMTHDFYKVCSGARDSLSFMAKYGHLRPGTYDILSPRYIDRPQQFTASCSEIQNLPTFRLTGAEEHALNILLKEHSLPGDAANLFRYARQAIAGRELAKFVFSRNLSDILEIIALWGQSLGFEREDLAFIPLHSMLETAYTVNLETTESVFREQITKNREAFEKCRHIKLSYLIRSERDVYIVPQHRSAPNFVGKSRVIAPVARLSPTSSCEDDLSGKIVWIENADPGFDWIFTRGIAGLVTKFGGANSHMAIRCAEYGLPAAIGVGEKLFSDMENASLILLDPANSILKSEKNT